MSHDLEVFADAAAFFSAREVAWHGLGTVVPDNVTAEEAMTLAHLASWNLRMVPDVALIEDNFVPVEGFSRVIRNNPFIEGKIDVLGHVSDRYALITNEEVFALLDAIGQVGGAKFETAGSIDNGKRVFATMVLPEELKIGGDVVENYVLVTTAHDGTGALEALVIPNRVVCRNTLNLAFREASRRVAVRHTTNARDRMAEAVAVMTNATDYVAQFKKAADRLAAKKMGLDAVDEFLKDLFPLDRPGLAQSTITRAENKRDEVRALALHSPTIQDEFRGTAWGVFQAVTEWYDWASPTKGADDPSQRRAIRSTFEDQGSAFKTKAYKALVAA